jgi:hypothetical protein
MKRAAENENFDLCPFFLPILCSEMSKDAEVIISWVGIMPLLGEGLEGGWRIWDASGCWHFRVWTKFHTLRIREEGTDLALED